MRTYIPASACAIALGLLLGGAPGLGAAAPAPPAKAAATPKAATPPRSATGLKGAIPKAVAPQIAGPAGQSIEPQAVAALRKMSAYLATLSGFELKADTTLDVVTEDGQRVQVGGISQYKVRRPDAFRIDLVTDYMHRQFFYDGKKFTVSSPELGYYASAPAPATIRETLDTIYDKFGIALPLEDLFRWNDPSSGRAEKLDNAWEVGPATIDGVATDHYAFREGSHDWEVWIDQGDKPLPHKLVIVDRTDTAHPTYVARLSWTINPTLAADEFAFRPGPDAKQIHLAQLAR